MKKWIGIVLTLSLLIALTACTSSKPNKADDPQTETAAPQTETVEPTAQSDALREVLAQAGSDDLLLVWVNPPEDVLAAATASYEIDPKSMDKVLVAAVRNDTEVEVLSGTPLFSDNDGAFDGWDTAAELADVELECGQAAVFSVTVPEGEPSYCLDIEAGEDGILWPVAAFDGKDGAQWCFVETYKW